MTQLTPTESHAIKEAERDHVIAIEKLGFFATIAHDPELRTLAQSTQRQLVQHYEELRRFGEFGQPLESSGIAAYAPYGFSQAGSGNFGQQAAFGANHTYMGPMPQTFAGGTVPTTSNWSTSVHPEPKAPWQPQSQPSALSDRTIVGDMLAGCKYLASCLLMQSLECAHPTLRQTLKQLACAHVDLAYEAYKYMEKNGWYGTINATQKQVSQIASQFQGVNQTVPQVGSYAAAQANQIGYANEPVYGSQSHYGNQTSHGSGSAYGTHTGYGTGSTTAYQPGYGTQNTTGSQPGYGTQSTFASQAQGATPAFSSNTANFGTHTGIGSPSGYGTQTGTGNPSSFGTQTGIGSASGYYGTQTGTDNPSSFGTQAGIGSPSNFGVPSGAADRYNVSGTGTSGASRGWSLPSTSTTATTGAQSTTATTGAQHGWSSARTI